MWSLLLLAAAVATSAECPRHCECKWRSGKESALCVRASLSAVPPRLDPTTQLLDLSENRLPILRDDVFASAGLLNLQRLYLASCNVRTVRQFAFRDLVNLVELDLSRNRLERTPSNAFKSILELRELRLSGNPITRIEDDAFASLPRLVRLSLSSCKISEIEPRAFKGLEASLEYLELDRNRIQILHAAVLAPLRSLKGLELAYNLWECTCALRPMREWMIRKNVPATVSPDCALPPRLNSQSWDKLDLDDFACLPDVSASSTIFQGKEGYDVTLVCKIVGIPTPKIKWTRGGRSLSNFSSNISSGKTYIIRSEKEQSNLTIKYAEIQDSGLYTCNAENKAGKAEVALSLFIEKQSFNGVLSGSTIVGGMAIIAAIVLSSFVIIIYVNESRKKRQLDRWNEQIVTSNNLRDSYEKIEAHLKSNPETPKGQLELSRKRGNYRNVPSHDSEDDCESYLREGFKRKRELTLSMNNDHSWNLNNLQSIVSGNKVPMKDLHVPRFSEYNERNDAPEESIASSESTAVINGHTEQLSMIRFNNNSGDRTRPQRCNRLDNDFNGSDSEKNYPDLIEMSGLGASTYLHGETKRDPSYFYTIPRRKEGESRSPLLSRRNSSGGDSAIFFDKPYGKTSQVPTSRKSSSFLDLSISGNRSRRNPSLPSSPSREQYKTPSATPLLDLSGLRDYSCMEQTLNDFDFRASQLETFLEEYRCLREQLSRMKETRENLQRTRALDSDDLKSVFKAKPSVAVTETSSSVVLANAASPLAISSNEYKTRQSKPEWLAALLYRH